MSDDNLFDLVRDGDRRAIAELFATNLDFIREQAKKVASQDGGVRSSDLVQSSILRMLEGLPRFRGETKASFRSWSATILKNTLREKQRHRSAAKRAGEQLQDDLDPADLRDETPSGTNTQIEALMALSRAMDQLTLRDRRILEMRLLDGLPYTTIAEELELSVSVARALASRARASVTIAMAKEGFRAPGLRE